MFQGIERKLKMLPKPKHLKPENSVRFQDQSVVDHYHLRLPYPAEVFTILASLIMDEPHTVLDVGTGIGNIARGLLDFAVRVDAVDFSPAMVAKGKTLFRGADLKLNWLTGQIEAVALQPPYALITAADSIHWMDWEMVFSRFADILTPHGYVALIPRNELPTPWQEGLSALIPRYSTIKDFQHFDLIEELEKRHLFMLVGDKTTIPVMSVQSIDDYIASFHSRSSLSLDHMPPEDAVAFDTQLKALVLPFSHEGKLELYTVGQVQWGKPQRDA
jgi:SAM-dependent methyltransferase